MPRPMRSPPRRHPGGARAPTRRPTRFARSASACRRPGERRRRVRAACAGDRACSRRRVRRRPPGPATDRRSVRAPRRRGRPPRSAIAAGRATSAVPCPWSASGVPSTARTNGPMTEILIGHGHGSLSGDGGGKLAPANQLQDVFGLDVRGERRAGKLGNQLGDILEKRPVPRVAQHRDAALQHLGADARARADRDHRFDRPPAARRTPEPAAPCSRRGPRETSPATVRADRASHRPRRPPRSGSVSAEQVRRRLRRAPPMACPASIASSGRPWSKAPEWPCSS